MIIRLTKKQKINGKDVPSGKVMAVEKWLAETLECEILEAEGYDYKHWKTTEVITVKTKKNESKNKEGLEQPEG